MNFLVSMIEFKSKLSEKFDRFKNGVERVVFFPFYAASAVFLVGLQKYLDWKDEKKVEKYKS